ncbi:MAG: DUF4388 domain-containing protein [Nitrospiraceae bacterium]|nr:DUF4388 domain-containing protein [Nitrospiraceae bacterium]
MALEGSLTDFGLADILQLIYFQRKTGVLSLAGKMDRVRLLFIDGKITGAESKRRIDDNRLGKILLKKGLLKEPDLQLILEEQKKTGSKLGAILIRKGLVDRALVLEILTSQISETVIQLFSWKQGTYEFTAQGVPLDKDLDLSLDTQHLLMEGLRIVDEWSLIKGKISLDSLFMKKEEISCTLSDEEQEIFGYVDGENDVSTIIDLSGQDNFQVSKTLLALLEKGCIAAIETVEVAEQTASVAETRHNLLGYLAPAAILVSALLALIGPLFQPMDYLRDYRASKSIEELRSKIEAYRIEQGTYPEALSVVTSAKDPWGRAYIYRVTGQAYILKSNGADGREGTADDID